MNHIGFSSEENIVKIVLSKLQEINFPVRWGVYCKLDLNNIIDNIYQKYPNSVIEIRSLKYGYELTINKGE